MVAAAVAVLKWAEEEVVFTQSIDAAVEALTHATACCLDADDFTTAVQIWLEAIPKEEYDMLKRDAQRELQPLI